MPDAPPSGDVSDSGDEPPTPVRSDLEDRLADADGLLALWDFDGTLAPIVEDPDAAAPLPGVTDALERLRDADGVAVGLVSGRALADLRERVGVDGVRYAGNHGLELYDPDDPDAPTVHPDARAASETIRSLATELTERLADVDGARVEDKRVTATVHFRGVDDERVPDVVETVEEAVADRDADLRVTSGKQIREIRPDVDWDKGAAVEWLRDRLVPDGERWVTTYVGDDVTDQDAFAAIGDGIGVRVGERAEVADYRVDGPSEAQALLQWLAGPGSERLAADGDDA